MQWVSVVDFPHLALIKSHDQADPSDTSNPKISVVINFCYMLAAEFLQDVWFSLPKYTPAFWLSIFNECCYSPLSLT